VCFIDARSAQCSVIRRPRLVEPASTRLSYCNELLDNSVMLAGTAVCL
jgi:hypothetical protein